MYIYFLSLENLGICANFRNVYAKHLYQSVYTILCNTMLAHSMDYSMDSRIVVLYADNMR